MRRARTETAKQLVSSMLCYVNTTLRMRFIVLFQRVDRVLLPSRLNALSALADSAHLPCGLNVTR